MSWRVSSSSRSGVEVALMADEAPPAPRAWAMNQQKLKKKRSIMVTLVTLVGVARIVVREPETRHDKYARNEHLSTAWRREPLCRMGRKKWP
jgi:hypothetical protein